MCLTPRGDLCHPHRPVQPQEAVSEVLTSPRHGQWPDLQGSACLRPWCRLRSLLRGHGFVTRPVRSGVVCVAPPTYCFWGVCTWAPHWPGGDLGPCQPGVTRLGVVCVPVTGPGLARPWGSPLWALGGLGLRLCLGLCPASHSSGSPGLLPGVLRLLVGQREVRGRRGYPLQPSPGPPSVVLQTPHWLRAEEPLPALGAIIPWRLGPRLRGRGGGGARSTASRRQSRVSAGGRNLRGGYRRSARLGICAHAAPGSHGSGDRLCHPLTHVGFCVASLVQLCSVRGIPFRRRWSTFRLRP